MEKREYYNFSAEDVIKALESMKEGLGPREAEERLEKYGWNELLEKKKDNPIFVLLRQFKSFLIIILIIAAVVSFYLGEAVDAIVIILIVLMAGILGFIQEYRAEKSIEALKEMAAPIAKVLREGRIMEVPSRNLVPGDIIQLAPGDKVPADGRIIESFELKVNESSLTGESAAVAKNNQTISGEAALSERNNMVFSGTLVTYGRCRAIIVGTGMDTQFGQVANLLVQIEKKTTPLQESLDGLGKNIGLITLVVVVFVTLLGLSRGYDFLEMFIWSVALAVAAIPEALPAVVTVALGLGIRRMVRRRALIRYLPAVETLGSIDVICSDKTGTLTQGEMTVTEIRLGDLNIKVTGSGYEPVGEFIVDNDPIKPLENPDLKALLTVNALCNDALLVQKDGQWKVEGDTTEGALLSTASKADLDSDVLEFERTGEIPFSSERKMMTTIHSTGNGHIAYSKGATEVIIDRCSHILRNGEPEPMSETDREGILEKDREMASRALRVLSMTYRPLEGDNFSSGDAEKDMIFIGMCGMIDPPREEVKEAIRTCTAAGIRTVMITGDNKLTALSIARELGILKNGRVMTGLELDKIDDKELEELVQAVQVYARVSPYHKMRLVEALQKKNWIVAMTGDGVNDAPALKKADIGVSMGITGTEVTKEASDMILLDDNFTTIVSAVEEGRNIYKNIRNFVTFGLSCHLAEILIVFIALMIGYPLPLVATQILWINLITDGLPPMALSVEPPDPGLMKEKPRGREQGILTKRVVLSGAGLGGVLALLSLIIFINYQENLLKAQTMVFTMVVVGEMFNALNWRSANYSIFKLGFFTNRPLILAILSTLILQALVIYAPFLQEPFSTTALSLNDLGIIFTGGIIFLLAGEIMKKMFSRIDSPGEISTL